MPEARASWNTLYVDREGFECQITIRDEDERNLLGRAAAVVGAILDADGAAARRLGANGNNHSNSVPDHKPAPQPERPEKTYVDDKGVRRCNLKVKSGRRCNTVVVEKDGKYGRFWSCANFRDHAS